MSDTRKDGGPAFPFDDYHNGYAGMTLRDWFAGQALAGIMSNPQAWLDSDGVLRAEIYAYQKADAMLAAREAAQ